MVKNKHKSKKTEGTQGRSTLTKTPVLAVVERQGFVKHGDGQYVQGNCHTNTIEGFFSLLKRGIVGIYHFVSAKHLDNYLNEFTFRYNSKDFSEENRFNLLLSATADKRLTYQNLIANNNG